MAELLNEASLIIWDEGPMAHKFYFEALDQSQRDVIKAKSSSDKIFDGKVMVFGGDFNRHCHFILLLPLYILFTRYFLLSCYNRLLKLVKLLQVSTKTWGNYFWR